MCVGGVGVKGSPERVSIASYLLLVCWELNYRLGEGEIGREMRGTGLGVTVRVRRKKMG